MIAGVFGDLTEKYIQGLRHLDYRSPIFLALVFLFKDKSSEAGAQEADGGFISDRAAAWSAWSSRRARA